MKWLIPFLLTVLLTIGFTADYYNLGTVTQYDNDIYSVSYVITIDSSAIQNYDSTDNFHTQALYIGDANYVDGRVCVELDDSTEFDVIFHYSNDLTNWVAQTLDTDFDSLKCTTSPRTYVGIYDTIGINQGTNVYEFHNSNWLVIELDGQDDLTWDNTSTQFRITVKLYREFPAQVNNQAIKLGDYQYSLGSP